MPLAQLNRQNPQV